MWSVLNLGGKKRRKTESRTWLIWVMVMTSLIPSLITLRRWVIMKPLKPPEVRHPGPYWQCLELGVEVVGVPSVERAALKDRSDTLIWALVPSEYGDQICAKHLPNLTLVTDLKHTLVCCLKCDRGTESHLFCQDALCTCGRSTDFGADPSLFSPSVMMSLFLLLWLRSMEDFTLTREPCSLDKRQSLRMTSLRKRRKISQG